jgi:hypothetical protein
VSEPTDPPVAAQLIADLTRERDDLRREVALLRSELRRLVSAIGVWRAQDTPTTAPNCKRRCVPPASWRPTND